MVIVRRILIIFTALAMSACAAASVPTPESTTTVPVTAADPTTTTTTLPLYRGFEATNQPAGSLVVVLGAEIPIYGQPGDDFPAFHMPATTILGTTTVLAATGPPRDGWAEVMLPVRPNGSTGWVRTEDVAMYVVDHRIEVSLGDRELVYYVGDEEVLRTAVAIGTPRNPTPTGTYFVTDNVRIARSSGPWGPAALGLSARSDTITEFNGGDGIIAIHGTNRPGSIGQAASLGCIRLPNDLVLQLHELVPIGTTVEIRA